MNLVDTSLKRLLLKHPEFVEWINNENIRSAPKQLNHHRLQAEKFENKELFDSITLHSGAREDKLNILFAHFSPFENELEGLGLPMYASKLLPNCNIDFTYDKGGPQSFSFTTSGGAVARTPRIRDAYDIIISRSSALSNMMNRPGDSVVVKSSDFKVNIKTMSYQPNYVHADHYFDEEDMCPPADPIYSARAQSFLKRNKKKNMIVVSGTLWYVKNQLKMFQQLDPDVVKDYEVVIMGPLRDHGYVSEIIRECTRKQIDFYLLGSVSRDFANDIKTLSKVSIIPMDMRTFGQPKGYPRTLGESIGSRCLTLCNSPVTVPDFYNDSTRSYREDIEGDLNSKLQKCIHDASQPGFIDSHDWGKKSFNQVCHETIEKCLNLFDTRAN